MVFQPDTSTLPLMLRWKTTSLVPSDVALASTLNAALAASRVPEAKQQFVTVTSSSSPYPSSANPWAQLSSAKAAARHAVPWLEPLSRNRQAVPCGMRRTGAGAANGVAEASAAADSPEL